jgi:hypothetical protein
MNALLIGQKYIITCEHDSTHQKPPAVNEWLVEVLGFNRELRLVNVKFLSGASYQIGNTRYIEYDNYKFSLEGDYYTQIKKEFMQFKAMEAEVRSNLDNYMAIREDIEKRIKHYKEMEWEVLFFRAAFIIIVWMYINGTIRYA